MTRFMHTKAWKDMAALALLVVAAVVLWVVLLAPLWQAITWVWGAWGW